jgi:hypothetical protein
VAPFTCGSSWRDQRIRNDALLSLLKEQAAFRRRLVCAMRLVCHARNSQDRDETYPAEVNMDAGFSARFPSRILWGQQGETLLLWRSMQLSGEYLKAVLLHWLTVSAIRECPCSIRRHASLLVLVRFPGKNHGNRSRVEMPCCIFYIIAANRDAIGLHFSFRRN